jgi:endonuclease/exonuclease/phosphatase family metal-dependent hydrolase
MDFAKWIFAISLAFFSLSTLACPNTDCVRIGSWNIAWLGSEKREQLSDAATIDSMAQLIADEWSIDLISLEEINTAIDGDMRGEHYSTQQWNQLRAALQKKGYRTQAGNSGNAQHIVFAWRKPVEVVKLASDMEIPDSYRIDDYCRSSNLRKPLAGLFRAGQFDFWAIGLHLKSGYGGKTFCSNAVRSMQVYYISKQLSTLEKTDKDILLMGDFNATSKHDSLQGFRENGFVATLTDKAKHSRVIDHVMINPAHTAEWKDSSTVLYKPENREQFAKRYSDHVPVWGDFSTLRDDD